ncbi:MAG: hypothetical protein HY843_04690, partial [Bdellovibrio sp.]|nr:hypothetical protein [Bdellovibrio sp.]
LAADQTLYLATGSGIYYSKNDAKTFTLLPVTNGKEISLVRVKQNGEIFFLSSKRAFLKKKYFHKDYHKDRDSTAYLNALYQMTPGAQSEPILLDMTNQLPSDFVFDVNIDSYDHLWVSTDSGVVVEDNR